MTLNKWVSKTSTFSYQTEALFILTSKIYCFLALFAINYKSILLQFLTINIALENIRIWYVLTALWHTLIFWQRFMCIFKTINIEYSEYQKQDIISPMFSRSSKNTVKNIVLLKYWKTSIFIINEKYNLNILHYFEGEGYEFSSIFLNNSVRSIPDAPSCTNK